MKLYMVWKYFWPPKIIPHARSNVVNDNGRNSWLIYSPNRVLHNATQTKGLLLEIPFDWLQGNEIASPRLELVCVSDWFPCNVLTSNSDEISQMETEITAVIFWCMMIKNEFKTASHENVNREMGIIIRSALSQNKAYCIQGFNSYLKGCITVRPCNINWIPWN